MSTQTTKNPSRISRAKHPITKGLLRSAARPGVLALFAAATFLTPTTAEAQFQINFNFSANTTAEQQQYFNEAAAYWTTVIGGYKSGVNLNGLTIDADVSYIDGAGDASGNTLGQAGPGNLQTVNGSTYATTGSMQFDSWDVDNMIANGSFADVIKHEMGHVLGIGTLWRSNNLYVNGTGQYTGINALNAWRDEFSRSGDNSVPVELGGGSGTANGHWDEGNSGTATGWISKYYGRDFQYELMTGWANSPTYTSMVTLGSLMDMGYTIAIPTDANGNYALTLGRIFSGLDGAHSMTKTTDGLVTLTTAGTLTGGSTIQAGKVVLENAQALGTGPVTLTGGTLDVGAVGATGIGTLTLRSGAINGTTGTISASSYVVESGSVSAILGGAGVTLTKNTTGTVTLSGQNTYTGATAVNAGSLILSGGSLGNTAVTVASGAGFGGNGTVGGAVTFNNGSTLLASTTGALTVNGLLTVGTNSRIDFADLPVVGNTYTVLNYTGGGSGLNNFTTTFRGTVDTSVAGQVKVTANATVPLTWKGTSDGAWGIVDGKNNFARTTGGQTDNFYQGDSITFDDTATNKNLTLTGRLLPGSITVNNSAGNNYTFGGTGEIAGTTGITKSGAGTLSITGAHTFTGKTVINGGVVQIASDASLGAAPSSAVADHLTLAGGTLRAGANLSLAANRGLTVNAASGIDTNGHNMTVGGAVAGASGLTKTGAGTLTLSGAGTITGNVRVSAGQLTLSNLSGTGYNNLEVDSQGTLLINDSNAGNQNLNRNIIVHGNGATSTTGLQIASGENFLLQGTLTLKDAATTIRAAGTGTAILSTKATDDYSNSSVIKVEAGASGSVIASNIQFGGPSYYSNNFGETIDVTAGANNATGDLRIDGTLRQGTRAYDAPMDIRGSGSVNLTAASSAYTEAGFTIQNNAQLMFTGSASLGGGSNSGSIQFVNSGAKLIWKSSATQTLSGVISGAGALNVGAGKLILSGANSFSAGTTVTGGTLVTANASALGTGSVSVANGATLQVGDGTTNGVTLGSAATLAMATDATLKLGAANSKITMGSGAFTLSNGVNIDITGLNLGAGTYTVIAGTAAGSTVGTWSASSDLIGGDLSAYAYSLARVGTNAVLSVTAVPEPATYGLLGAGTLACVAAVRRRRRRAAGL